MTFATGENSTLSAACDGLVEAGGVGFPSFGSFNQLRKLKLLYAAQAQSQTPTIALFVNDPAQLHFAYQRYLENRIRAVFGFAGVPLRVVARARAEKDDGGVADRRRAAIRGRR